MTTITYTPIGVIHSPYTDPAKGLLVTRFMQLVLVGRCVRILRNGLRKLIAEGNRGPNSWRPLRPCVQLFLGEIQNG